MSKRGPRGGSKGGSERVSKRVSERVSKNVFKGGHKPRRVGSPKMGQKLPLRILV